MTELSEEDKYMLRENYSDISRALNPKDVILDIEEQGLLSDSDKTYLKKDNITDDKITEFIIFQLLICSGTYEVLSKLRDILTKRNQVNVLEYLPNVTSNDNSEPPVEQQLEDSTNEDQPVGQDLIDSPTQENTEQADANSDDSSESDEEKPEVVKSAGKLTNAIKKLSPKKKKKKHKDYIKVEESEQNAIKDYQSNMPNTGQTGGNVQIAGNIKLHPKVKRITKFTDAFLNYEPKAPGSRHGKGLCVVFSLFTGDMPGYPKDVAALEQFFSGIEYEVWCNHRFENLTQDELFDRIRAIVTYISANRDIDRLVVVILTHGKEDGLLTCADKEGLLYEEVTRECRKRDGSKYRVVQSAMTKVEEIVEYFKHDTLTNLKGMPKLFLIQTCRGSEIVRAANAPGSEQHTEDRVDGLIDPTALRFNPLLPIDADIMICYAATERHSSLVNPHTGSWFIQQTLEVFKQHYKTEHVADMMTVVKLAVAELRGVINHNDGSQTHALQIPTVFSTFRKRFYLYNQPQLFVLERGPSRSQLPDIRQNQFITSREKQQTPTFQYNEQTKTNPQYIKPHYV